MLLLRITKDNGLTAQTIKDVQVLWAAKFKPELMEPVYLSKHGSFEESGGLVIGHSYEDNKFESWFMREHMGLEYKGENEKEEGMTTKNGKRTPILGGFAGKILTTARNAIARRIDPPKKEGKKQLNPFNLRMNAPSTLSLPKSKDDARFDPGRRLFYCGKHVLMLGPDKTKELVPHFKGYKGWMGSLKLPKVSQVPSCFLKMDHGKFMQWVTYKETMHRMRIDQYGKDETRWDEAAAIEEYHMNNKSQEKLKMEDDAARAKTKEGDKKEKNNKEQKDKEKTKDDDKREKNDKGQKDKDNKKGRKDKEKNKKGHSEKEVDAKDLSSEELINRCFTGNKLNGNAPRVDLTKRPGNKKRKVS